MTKGKVCDTHTTYLIKLSRPEIYLTSLLNIIKFFIDGVIWPVIRSEWCHR